MNYLQCVRHVTKAQIPDFYTNYSEYWRLGRDDIIRLVALAHLYDLKVLCKIGVFIPVDSNNKILNGSSNKYFEIQNTKFSYLGTRVIQIGQIQLGHIFEVMLFSKNWSDKYYNDAYKRCLQQISESTPRRIYTPNVNRNYMVYFRYS